MTETEWLNGTNPKPMLDFLQGKASDRKLRLLAVTCCRSVWSTLPISVKAVVQVVDCFVDGKATQAEFNADVHAALAQGDGRFRGIAYHHGSIWYCDHIAALQHLAQECAEACIVFSSGKEQGRQAVYLRCIFGNPFRTLLLNPAWLAWNDGTVVKLAQAIYDERILPEGILDNGRLAILADALEEAGCTDQEILSHLRQQRAVHVRGCFAVDAVLGKP